MNFRMSADDDWARAVDLQEGLNRVQLSPGDQITNYSNPTMPISVIADNRQNGQNENTQQTSSSNQVRHLYGTPVIFFTYLKYHKLKTSQKINIFKLSKKKIKKIYSKKI